MTKNESNIVKGIAILCMFFHHLFYVEERYTTYGFTGLIGNADITLTIAKDMKVCVAIFAFVSGYGMVMKMRNLEAEKVAINAKWHVKNIADSYLNMIKDTCFLIVIVVSTTLVLGLQRTPEVVWGEESSDIILGILSNMTGLAGYFGINWFIRSWWYLKVAVLFIVLFPVLYTILRKCGVVFLLCLSVVVMPYVFGMNVKQDNIWRYLPAFLFGMTLADKGIIEKLSHWSKEKYRGMIAAALLVFMCGVMAYVKHKVGLPYITQSTQAVIISIFGVLILSEIPFVSHLLIVFGKNSKYMWLIHVYIYGQLVKDVLFSLKNIWLIFICLLVISLLLSIILKKVCDMLFGRMGKFIEKARAWG